MDKWLLDAIEADGRSFVPVISGNSVRLIAKKTGWPNITLWLAELTNQQFIEAIGLCYGAYNDCVLVGKLIEKINENTVAIEINNQAFHFQK